MQSEGLGSVLTIWSVSANFSGDGKADWLCQDTGDLVHELHQIAQSMGVGNVSTAWSIVGMVVVTFSGATAAQTWRDLVHEWEASVAIGFENISITATGGVLTGSRSD
jgi:hypothetical protein